MKTQNELENLSGQSIIKYFKESFKNFSDQRTSNKLISIDDALISAFAVFSLKFPSLLKFENEVRNGDGHSNLKSVYGVSKIPSDTQMREIIDPIDSEKFNKLFKGIFQKIQRDKKLNAFEFQVTKDRTPSYLMPVDGTGYFSSDSVHCESCLSIHTGSNKGKFYHQMLSAAIVHPDMKTVIPMAPEPILKQDGHVKNDCEYNAFKRFAAKFRKDHPKLKVIICGDALYARGELVKVLMAHNMSYILSVKPGLNTALFNYVNGADERENVSHFEYDELIGDKVKKKVTHRFRYKNKAPLDNKSSMDFRVNFLEYWEITEWINNNGKECREEKHFSWATDINLTKESVIKVMRGGRARWNIENEVFNTLKNHGYHFEHNFGHGNINLSTNFAKLMMLAFYMDQVQEMCCKFFKKLLAKLKQKSRIWERIRFYYQEFKIDNWESLLSFLANKEGLISLNSS